MRTSRKADGRPAFQFYVDDWLSEMTLRVCPLQDRGLWMDMLCIMWKAPRRGFLEAGGSRIEADGLARMVGADEADVKQSLGRMQAAGVYETDESGTIYCRRMVRDEKQRLSKVEAGRLGGLASKPQAEPQAKGGSSSSSSSSLPASQEDVRRPTPAALHDDAERLTALLAKRIAGWNPMATIPAAGSPGWATWAREMDRLLRIGPPGKQSPIAAPQIEAVIDWIDRTPRGAFWRQNILSAPTFRKQFARLWGQRREDLDRDHRKQAAADDAAQARRAREADHRAAPAPTVVATGGGDLTAASEHIGAFLRKLGGDDGPR